MRTRTCDVAIVGGGPAGAAAAIALARAGRRVLLADACGANGRPRDAFRIGEGLPAAARPLLQALGVLERTLADGHRASPGTQAWWGSDTPHTEDAMRTLQGRGLQLDRIRFDAMLRAAAGEAGAECVDAAQLRLVAAGDTRTPHRLRLQRAHGDDESIDADWLIDAGGRGAGLSRALGATRIVHDRLLAFHLRLHGGGDTDRDGRTLVEAVEDGWWYSVRLPSEERLIAFLGDADLLDRRTLIDGDGLWHALERAPHLHALCARHGWRPGGPTQGADACSSELDHACGERWLAVGDAALAFDPLSSKGISNALYTGLQAAEAILRSDHTDDAVRDPAALAAYAQHLREIHRVYRAQLRAFYAMETRWPASPFWRRRSVGEPSPSTTFDARSHSGMMA